MKRLRALSDMMVKTYPEIKTIARRGARSSILDCLVYDIIVHYEIAFTEWSKNVG